ncbi:hypothetical protein BDA99DRAFT_607711 [Phascolomyces articulosus]|uniref:PH domain-containing protein n=1 Tax=Phascolomyces articulosus TaxID=60185 RepID=A0AAD5K6D0_9FUNG|nr:hypothetical protein BDA99DRAFT_607711 [Phascolomyces articulosus]
MRMDSEQRIKISGWRKRQPTIEDINFNDPASFRPLAMGKHPQLLWPHATIQGWMTKHMPPAFSFTKTRHRRYVLLLDRIIYTFKNDNPKHDFREFFELTANTNIFVTDQFPSVLYCIEIQRKEDGRTWYLQAEEGPEELKLWMDKLKRTVQCLKLDEEEHQQLQLQQQQQQQQQHQVNSQYPYQHHPQQQQQPRYHGFISAVITNERLDKVQLDSDNPPPTTAQKEQQQYPPKPKKPSVSSTSSSEASYEKYNSLNSKNRYSTYSNYHLSMAPPPPQQPPPSIPPPPIPQNYYYYPEHQISVEHMTTSAAATASAALVSPLVVASNTNLSSTSRRPSRLPEHLREFFFLYFTD